MEFWKYHGLGNDFVIVEHDALPSPLTKEKVIAVCDRRRGIGADGILLVQSRPDDPRMVVFNADGSKAEMCGNGLRCVAHYLRAQHEGFPTCFCIKTGAGPLEVRDWGETIEVDMGTPEDLGQLVIRAENSEHQGHFIKIGNPHFVIFGKWAGVDIALLGEDIENDEHFPDGVNVSFARHTSHNTIELRVWERGCGLTSACGTGACATAYASWRGKRGSAGELNIDLPGGSLKVAEHNSRIKMTGPATPVFFGQTALFD